MTSEALKPCPCGSKAELHEDISMSGKGRFWVQSEAGWVGPVKSEPDDAIDFWNTRIDTLPATADREANDIEWIEDACKIFDEHAHSLGWERHIYSDRLRALSPKVTEISGGSDNIGNSDPGWRSMESAPKDGGWFIAEDINGDICPLSYLPDVHGGDNDWRDHEEGHAYSIDFFTHWMPLPAAPDATKQPEQDAVREAARVLLPEIAPAIISCHDAFIDGDHKEAWHQFRQMMKPFSNNPYDVFEEAQSIALAEGSNQPC